MRKGNETCWGRGTMQMRTSLILQVDGMNTAAKLLGHVLRWRGACLAGQLADDEGPMLNGGHVGRSLDETLRREALALDAALWVALQRMNRYSLKEVRVTVPEVVA
jgi:hypothetical protein